MLGTAGPRLLRQSGRAELTGDLLLMCTNGSGPRTVNFTLYLANTQVASRILSASMVPEATEALLLVDEPIRGEGSTAPVPCPASAVCQDANVYQGRLGGPNSLVFTNVKLNVPAGGMQMLRFTNIRVDARQLGASAPYGPPVQAMAALTSSDSALKFESSPVPVGFNLPEMEWQLREKTNESELSAPVALSQCTPNNAALARNRFSPSVPDGVSFVVRLQEFLSPSAFRKLTIGSAPSADMRPAPAAQNVPGALYDTESGFLDPAYPATDGMNQAGLATQATRFIVRFRVSGKGIQIHAPLYESGRNASNSRVRLVAGNQDGASPVYGALRSFSSFNNGLSYAPDMSYVYEVTASGDLGPYSLDSIDLPFVIAHAGGAAVSPGEVRASVNLAPVATNRRLGQLAVPRFADLDDWRDVAVVAPCANAQSRRSWR